MKIVFEDAQKGLPESKIPNGSWFTHKYFPGDIWYKSHVDGTVIYFGTHEYGPEALKSMNEKTLFNVLPNVEVSLVVKGI